MNREQAKILSRIIRQEYRRLTHRQLLEPRLWQLEQAVDSFGVRHR